MTLFRQGEGPGARSQADAEAGARFGANAPPSGAGAPVAGEAPVAGGALPADANAPVAGEARTGDPEASAGMVYLVGAGPGDPGLLTRRGAELLARADTIVHDRLSSPALLALAPAGAELVDVGKQPDDRGDQEAINELLVAKARAGRRVVRLKGGDPFVFGRGGEEAMALLEAGVPFEVVPGVSSATAVPASAGVPVTHRGLAGSFTVVAGHRRSVELPASEGGTNWEALAAAAGTIVVLMGAAHRSQLAKRLIAGGLPPSTPVTAVRWGTEPYQTVERTTLGELHAVSLAPPVTIVIGEVAALDLSERAPDLRSRLPTPSSRLAGRPLSGKSVVVTRPAQQAAELVAGLRDLGAHPLEVPVVGIEAPADGGQALAGAVSRLATGAYAWVVFSSVNAVEQFFHLVPDARVFGRSSVAAIGPATAAALGRFRIVADLVPDEHSALGLVRVFSTVVSTGAGARSVLLPQAAGARPELRHGLEALGWRVDAVEAYRTVPRQVPAESLLFAGGAEAICFASPSAVTSYLDQAEAAGAGVPRLVACIGPSTSAAARARGLEVEVEAGEHTSAGLLAALAEALARPHA